MSRTELLDNNYKFEQKQPKGTIIFILRLSLALLFVPLSAHIGMHGYMFDSPDRLHLPSQAVTVIFIAIMLSYFILKVCAISLFCQYKKDSIATFKVLETGGISIFTCREALKMWQIILIYTVPAVLTYSMLSIAIIALTFESFFMFSLLLISLLAACDFTIALYIIYIKITYRPDYIAINHHIYNLTLYTKNLSDENILN